MLIAHVLTLPQRASDDVRHLTPNMMSSLLATKPDSGQAAKLRYALLFTLLSALSEHYGSCPQQFAKI